MVDNVSSMRLVTKFLSSNDPPTENELVQLSSEYRDRRDRIIALDQRIAKLQRELDSLTSERDLIRNDMNDYRTALHPIRRTPPEILSSIFLECVNPGLDTEVGSPSLDPKFFAWTAGQVSSRWRGIALTSPNIWSTIRIWIPNNFDFESKKCRGWVSMLGVQLYRSALNPLSVSIVSLQTEIPPGHPLQILLPTSPRWSHLLFGFPLNTFQSLSNVRGFLPSLKTLAIGLTRPYHNEELESSPLLTLFEYAPRLESIMAHPSFFKRCQTKWKNIKSFSSFATSVYRGASSPIVQLELLRLVPNLEVCQLYCRGSRSNPSEPRIILSHLIALTIEVTDDSCIHAVVDHLTLPALQELRLISDEMDVGPIKDLVERSKASLLHLSIRFRHLSMPTHFVDMLRLSPQLQSLTLDGDREHVNELLTAIVLADEIFVPDLRILTLTVDCKFTELLCQFRPRLRITEQSPAPKVTAIPQRIA